MRGLLGVLLLLAGSGLAAADEDWGHDFDALIAEPGTQVTYGLADFGDQTREIRLASGVVFTQVRHDGRIVSATGADYSGHGAVECVYSILLGEKAALSACATPQDDVAELDRQIARIEDFMVANALPPVSPKSRAAVRARIAGWKAQVQGGAAKLAPQAYCRSREAAVSLNMFRRQSRGAKLKASIDDLLSVPRPAVMEPCL